MIAAATNRPPITPPTMAGTLALWGTLVLWSVLLLIGLGNGGEGHPAVALHNNGFPKYLWYCHKKKAQIKMYLSKKLGQILAVHCKLWTKHLKTWKKLSLIFTKLLLMSWHVNNNPKIETFGGWPSNVVWGLVGRYIQW